MEYSTVGIKVPLQFIKSLSRQVIASGAFLTYSRLNFAMEYSNFCRTVTAITLRVEDYPESQFRE